MNLKKLKQSFAEVTKKIGFKTTFGCFVKETNEVIVVLSFQKSNFSPQVYLNIKLFVQGIFGKKYQISRDLVNNDVGDIFRRSPNDYDRIFYLNADLPDNERVRLLNAFVDDFLSKFVLQASTIKGILLLAEHGDVFLFPAVRDALEKILRP